MDSHLSEHPWTRTFPSQGSVMPECRHPGMFLWFWEKQKQSLLPFLPSFCISLKFWRGRVFWITGLISSFHHSPPKVACTYAQWLCDYCFLPECISRYFPELWFIWTSSANALNDVATAAMCSSFHPFPSGRAAWVEVSFAFGLERKGGLGRFYLYAFLFLLLIFICCESVLRRQRTEKG